MVAWLCPPHKVPQRTVLLPERTSTSLPPHLNHLTSLICFFVERLSKLQYVGEKNNSLLDFRHYCTIFCFSVHFSVSKNAGDGSEREWRSSRGPVPGTVLRRVRRVQHGSLPGGDELHGVNAGGGGRS